MCTTYCPVVVLLAGGKPPGYSIIDAPSQPRLPRCGWHFRRCWDGCEGCEWQIATGLREGWVGSCVGGVYDDCTVVLVVVYLVLWSEVRA